MVKTKIKQIIPIESGWVFQFLISDNGSIRPGLCPITGQALVEREYAGGPELEMDFIVVDEDRLLLLTDVMQDYDTTINTVPVGVTREPIEPDVEDNLFYVNKLKKKLAEHAKSTIPAGRG